MLLTRRQGFGRGFLHFEDNYQSVSDAFLNSSLYGYLFDYYGLRKALNYEGVPTRRLAPEINRSALQWIDQGDQPFIVFINYFDVHDPYTLPEPYLSKYGQTQGGLINGFIERYHPELTPEQLQSEIDAYDGSINYVDDQISALFAELESRGELENTIVIITADHGESLGEHGLLQHSASLYRQEIHGKTKVGAIPNIGGPASVVCPTGAAAVGQMDAENCINPASIAGIPRFINTLRVEGTGAKFDDILEYFATAENKLWRRAAAAGGIENITNISPQAIGVGDFSEFSPPPASTRMAITQTTVAIASGRVMTPNNPAGMSGALEARDAFLTADSFCTKNLEQNVTESLILH